MVVADKLDRALSRDPFAIIDMMEQNGCAFTSASQPFDTSTPVGKLLFAIVSAISANIQMHGIAGMVARALRDALVGSEPTIDAVISGNIDGGFDALLNDLAASRQRDTEGLVISAEH